MLIAVEMGGEDKVPVQLRRQLRAFQAGAEEKAVCATRRNRGCADALFPIGFGQRQPVIELRQLVGKTPFLLGIKPLLQRAGRERQATWSFAHAQIHAARREGGQHIEVFRHFVRAVVLEHDAAGTDANPAGLAEDPGDSQFRRRAGKLLGIVVFGYPETVIAPGFRLLRQR